MKELLMLVTQIVLLVFSADIPNSTCADRCCHNFYKNWLNGLCVECPLGSFGLNCNETCPPQYYGRLCRIKCDCPLQHCNQMYGCVYLSINDGGDNPWKYVALTLIGSIASLAAAGLMVFTRLWMARRVKQEINESNESQIGMDSLIPNGINKNIFKNFIEENKYEEHQCSPSRDEMEAIHFYNMSAENNYAELRTSALSPIYNSPDDFNTDLMQTTLMLTRPCLNKHSENSLAVLIYFDLTFYIS
ncbi:uncharacterized protein LOC128190557 [Crassostrea angulata]|uniref:uncharacterized protein LOC128190557 n=1 Tax=Magallana angulata TaxID=2784310 RepID=UPI0022B0EE70|nr:uncharacterized protein LOC128190557 [Crassostrea angulata]